ncbi:MAG: hypothetical protein QG671_3358 [Actinomycetota bacterium]|nr:hypothetical protein [Actinomycetota bacterium]
MSAPIGTRTLRVSVTAGNAVFATLVGIGNVIMKDGFGPEEAGQIINAAVWNYCPRHSELLETIGDNARAMRNLPPP